MKFLADLFRRWQIPIMLISVICVFLFGYAAASSAAKVRETQRQLREAAATRLSLEQAVRRLSASNERIAAREVRATNTVREIWHEEVTTGCGPSVHLAVDSLRDEQN